MVRSTGGKTFGGGLFRTFRNELTSKQHPRKHLEKKNQGATGWARVKPLREAPYLYLRQHHRPTQQMPACHSDSSAVCCAGWAFAVRLAETDKPLPS